MIWVVPLIMWPTHANGFLYPKVMAWLVSLWLVIGISFQTPMVRTLAPMRWFSWCSLYFILLGLWQLFRRSLILPQTTANVVEAMLVTSGLIPWLLILSAIISHRVVLSSTDHEARWRILAWHLIHVGVVIALYAILQTLGADSLFAITYGNQGVTVPNAPITTMGNPFYTSHFLGLIAPLCLIFRPVRFMVFYGLIALGCVLCGNTSGIAALVLGSLTVWMLRREWRQVMIAGLLVMAKIALIVMTGTLSHWIDAGGRLSWWHHALQILTAQHGWWFGMGLGSVASATANGFWNYGRLHNEWVQLVFETGLVGLFLVLAMLWHGLVRVWRTPMTSDLAGWCGVMVALLPCTMVGFPLYLAPCAMVVWVAWTAMMSLTEGVVHESV